MMPSLRWSGRMPFVRGLSSQLGVVLGGLSAFLLAACVGVEAVESPVPAYNVHYSCNISTINAALQQNDLPNLDSHPGVVLVNKYQNVSDNIGVCGLLLYHAATEDVFYAYDLACPYCYRRGTLSAIGMKDPFVARCPGCESEFGAVQYGSPAPTAGPANAENYHLRQYRARLTTYTTLVVTRK